MTFMPDQCFLCGKPGADTREHIPPKCLFPEPHPNDLLTVPAHRSCNQSYSADDEYLRVALTAPSYSDPIAHRLWRTKVVRSLGRARGVKFKQKLADDTVEIPLGNLTDGSTVVLPILRVEAPRLKRSIRRIVRGIHYARHKVAMNPATPIAVHLLKPEEGLNFWRRVFEEEGKTIVFKSIGNGIFQFSHKWLSGSPDSAIVFLLFYNTVPFATFSGQTCPEGEEEP